MIINHYEVWVPFSKPLAVEKVREYLIREETSLLSDLKGSEFQVFNFIGTHLDRDEIKKLGGERFELITSSGD